MADIELVIKIDEDTYRNIREYYEKNDTVEATYSYIYYGIPLPKGHKRLIEDNFDVGPVFNADGNIMGYRYVTREDLNNAQTIIEADKAESEGSICKKCLYVEEADGSHCYECIKGKSKFKALEIIDNYRAESEDK